MKTNTWQIDDSKLAAYQKGGWTEDYFKETSDGKYGIFIYNIDEKRMLAYYGLIAIYSDKGQENVLLNLAENWVWFDNERTFDYAPLSDCLIFKVSAYRKNSSKPDFPFLLIKPTNRIFAFISWDYTSIYYGFNERGIDKLAVKEVYANELTRVKSPKRTNEAINLAELTWYDLKQFGQAIDLYHEQDQ